MSKFDSDVAALNSACLDEFGDDIIYAPIVGSPFTIPAIVDLSERAALVYGGGAAGTAWAILSAFPSPPKSGDKLTFAGVDYRVSEDPNRKLDGSGGATPANDGVTLVLRRI